MGGGFAYEMELCIPKGPPRPPERVSGRHSASCPPGTREGKQVRARSKPPPPPHSRAAGLLLNPGWYRPHACDR